jgi:heme iron utilization protein
MARSFSGAEARLLLRRVRTASLGTVNRDGGGPYASVVNLATDLAGAPVIFASRLAWHTRNLLEDGRGCILASELPHSGDALTGPRVTVMGTFEHVDAAPLRERYAAHHPAARLYLDFADFSFWRLAADTIHAVAGFGRIETMPAAEMILETPDAALFESAIDHVNRDHADALRLYATKLLGAPDGDWRIGAADPDGCHLVLGDVSLRLPFEAPAPEAGPLRKAFADLAKKARAAA